MTAGEAWGALARVAAMHERSGGVEELSEAILGELMRLVGASAGQLLLASDLRTLASLPVGAAERFSLVSALDTLADDQPHWTRDAAVTSCSLPLTLHGAPHAVLLLMWEGPREQGAIRELVPTLPFVTLALSQRHLEGVVAEREQQLADLGERYDDAMQRAVTDGLTSLLNQAHFKELLGLELGRSRRYGNHLTLCLLDIDFFKQVNDSFGHLAGDVVIRRIAQAVKSLVRDCDLVARYGGEEFAVLLPQTELKGAMIVAERMRQRVRDLIFTGEEREALPTITVSIGVAEMRKLDTVTSFIERADQALYRAKQSGRNRVCSEADDLLGHLEVQHQADTQRQAFLTAVAELATEVALKDAYRADYAERMAQLAEELGQAMALAPSQQRDLGLAASLHHIGKIALPAHVLAKHEALSEPEWELIKTHPQLSQQLIGQIAGMGTVAEIILYHHERWDGSGYPYGLKGEQIPLPSRVLAVIDAFVAMIHDRPYRPALTQAGAAREIRSDRGTRWDPGVVDAFLALVEPDVTQHQPA